MIASQKMKVNESVGLRLLGENQVSNSNTKRKKKSNNKRNIAHNNNSIGSDNDFVEDSKGDADNDFVADSKGNNSQINSIPSSFLNESSSRNSIKNRTVHPTLSVEKNRGQRAQSSLPQTIIPEPHPDYTEGESENEDEDLGKENPTRVVFNQNREIPTKELQIPDYPINGIGFETKPDNEGGPPRQTYQLNPVHPKSPGHPSLNRVVHDIEGPEVNAPQVDPDLLARLVMAAVEKITQRNADEKKVIPKVSNYSDPVGRFEQHNNNFQSSLAEKSFAQKMIMNLPKFKGNSCDDIITWIEQLEELMIPLNFAEHEKIAILRGQLGESPLRVIEVQGVTYNEKVQALKSAYKSDLNPSKLMSEFTKQTRNVGEKPTAFVNRLVSLAAYNNKRVGREVINEFTLIEQIKKCLSAEQLILLSHFEAHTATDVAKWLEKDEQVRNYAPSQTSKTRTELGMLAGDERDQSPQLNEELKQRLTGMQRSIEEMQKDALDARKAQHNERRSSKGDVDSLAMLLQQLRDSKASGQPEECFNCQGTGHRARECRKPCKRCGGSHSCIGCKRTNPTNSSYERRNKRPRENESRDIRCRFDGKCTRRECPYRHTRKQPENNRASDRGDRQSRERRDDTRIPRNNRESSNSGPSGGVCNDWNTARGCSRGTSCKYRHEVRKTERNPLFDKPASGSGN